MNHRLNILICYRTLLGESIVLLCSSASISVYISLGSGTFNRRERISLLLTLSWWQAAHLFSLDSLFPVLRSVVHFYSSLQMGEVSA